ECGTETTVPFKPTQGRPVLCRSCFQGNMKASVAQPAQPVAESAPDLETAKEPLKNFPIHNCRG
ncbi:MAG TPA: CxxC-x17-CxxC domain-containing protein, partial [Acidobacteriaceae bacterium]|nr:CxxC-x17-CxxC domain-containing protein [Acidobacteriaceae bacterium]